MDATPESTPEQTTYPDRSKQLANLRPPWTPEEQRAASLKGAHAKKRYSLRGALAQRLKARRADGTRPWDDALSAFVEKLLQGDVRAIELAMNSVDGVQESKKRVEHSLARDLVVRPEASLPVVVEAESVQPLPELPPKAHDVPI